MTDIRMYCTAFCPYCVRAETLLKSKGISEITKIMVDSVPDGFKDMMELTGRRTVPQIYIGDRHIGGFDDLAALDRQGGLDPLLEAV
ncbi:MAG: glutaredoxin 3 [Gammaproteobacteria bacterium]|nr:glutaredoxin 3 [Gammaproteobacteria bacterium]MDH3888868.1 glutaredoxin 3 [Gammaproteobacteria bacterium]MDH3934482.1 glutaredoxin 3 [Gammaproteobacteria bacterium]MDH3972459.1 glutaredoxin 3 [Gammaproteobacteria bacterium]MDH3987391.1 glutaredoxin 3 [Gammaproteobacteria bacterium]